MPAYSLADLAKRLGISSQPNPTRAETKRTLNFLRRIEREQGTKILYKVDGRYLTSDQQLRAALPDLYPQLNPNPTELADRIAELEDRIQRLEDAI